MDECQNNNGECPQICSNTDGSFECFCDAGYIMNINLGCDGKRDFNNLIEVQHVLIQM